MTAKPTALRRRLRDEWVPATLVATALLAVAARLYQLGERVMYYDEAWFGYWSLKFLDHGYWQYRPTLHGPFYTWANRLVFPAFGADDFTARLVVALVGGLLPLSAWLYREHLRDVEVVALGLVFAFNPILLYYSRFMRKDVPLAAFVILALGLAVRAYDTSDRRYLYAAALALGIAFTTKESVVLWLLSWTGGGALVLLTRVARERGLFRPRAIADGVAASLGRYARSIWRWRGTVAVSLLVLFVVIVLGYAPRSGDRDAIGIWRALGGEYGMLPAVVAEATVGSATKVYEHWVLGGKQDHPYVPYFLDTIATLGAGALGVCVLGAIGYVHDQLTYRRPLIAANVYAGCAAVVGYPIANHFPVPWSTVHAVVPFSFAAAVGAGVVYRWSRRRLPEEERAFLRELRRTIGLGPATASDGGATTGVVDRLRGGRDVVAAIVLIGLVGSAGLTAVQTSYLRPHASPAMESGGNEIVYEAQAPGDLRVVADAIRRSAATGGADADVLYVGESIAMVESSVEYPPETGAWHRRVPLVWYTEAADADVRSVPGPDGIRNPPPVVIALPELRFRVGEALPGYEGELYELGAKGHRNVVVFRPSGSSTGE